MHSGKKRNQASEVTEWRLETYHSIRGKNAEARRERKSSISTGDSGGKRLGRGEVRLEANCEEEPLLATRKREPSKRE